MKSRLNLPGFAAALVLLALAAGLASCDRTEEDTSQAATDQPTPVPTESAGLTPSADVTLWRWGNVTILVPNDSGIYPLRNIAGPVEHPPDGGPVINLIRGDDSGLTIDAVTGEVLWASVVDSDQKAFDAIVGTIDAGGSMDVDSLPWPYDAKEPEFSKVEREGLRFWDPDPASGLTVSYQVGDSVSGGSESFIIESVKSRRAVDAHTGKVVEGYGQVAPEDQEAFDRWIASVELASAET
jgi:hypothetical protein